MDILILCAAAFLAGLIDSVAGGGGLIQLPALFVGLPPSLAASIAAVLGTNKLSSICGTSAAAVQYARHVDIPWRIMLPASATAFVSSAIGAHAVTAIPTRVLKPVILLLLVAVVLYTFANRSFGHRAHRRWKGRKEVFAASWVGAMIGFYDGFFGPGTGSFLLFALVSAFGLDFLTASAGAKVVNVATNLAAVIYFAATGNIFYVYAVPMAGCNVLGGWVGSKLAILRGNHFIRCCFVVVVVAATCRFGWELVSSW